MEQLGAMQAYDGSRSDSLVDHNEKQHDFAMKVVLESGLNTKPVITHRFAADEDSGTIGVGFEVGGKWQTHRIDQSDFQP